MPTRKDYLEHFPQHPWAKGHATVTSSSYPHAAPSDLENELLHEQRQQHAVGSTYHQAEGRAAGSFLNAHDELQDEESAQLEDLLRTGTGTGSAVQGDFTDEHKGVLNGLPDKRSRKKAAEVAGADGDAHVWNVREIKEVDADYKFANPEHHGYARYVLHATENALKTQPGALPPKQDEKKDDENDDVKESDDQAEVSSSDDSDSDQVSGDQVSEEEAAFLDSFLVELNHISFFRNNDGRDEAPLAAHHHDREMCIAEADQFTPDNWIPRSSHLIRLTGSSPMNAEPGLTELFEAGLITPTKLHYVRSHGEVPKLAWETHTLEVSGFMDNATTFTMDDIAGMPWINIPVTLACDGNRRKEVNMVKRSTGYNWGPGATSCVYWKGVLVRDILLACGVKEKPVNEHWFVHYEGADNPSEGRYSTHLPFEYVMDPTNDVMLAYEMNGGPLHPDHGHPLRSVIPGYVGGRCVKWLKKLWISNKPNMSYYHLYDNRVLPSFVDKKDSLIASAFFHHDSTACYEQILQSVICKPAHDEQIELDPASPPAPYRVQGYAYNGSGNIVSRVELSLDGGHTWKYCFRQFPDKPLRHGNRYWTWIHWYCDVEIEALANATEMAVRAYDSAKNTQPEGITWNLSGMMNNSIYRVRPFIMRSASGKTVLSFRHPVLPGSASGGWMKENPIDAARAEAGQQNQSMKEFTLEEFEKHNKEDDAWIVIDNNVYDVTSVLDWHPGGKSALLMWAGKANAEVGEQYKGIHDGYADSKRNEVHIGTFSKKAADCMAKDAERAKKQRQKDDEQRKDFALQKHKWTPITLLEKEQVSHDTHRFRFELPGGKDAKLGLPICQHVLLGLHFSDTMVTRPYTPIRPVLPEEEDGTVTLLIKTYEPNVGPFKPGGTMSNWVDCIEIGEQAIDIKGPLGEIEYKGRGDFVIEGKDYHFKNVNLLTGGSGVTPDWQLIKAALSDPEDNMKISFISSNKSKEDTLLFDEFQNLKKEHPDQLSVWFTASVVDDDWAFTQGHCDEHVMREHFFGSQDGQTGTFLCGPPGLMKACSGALEKMGFKNGETMFGF